MKPAQLCCSTLSRLSAAVRAKFVAGSSTRPEAPSPTDPGVRDALESALANFMAGSSDTRHLHDLAHSHRPELEEAMRRVAGAFAEEGIERLGALALDLQFVQPWCEAAASANRDLRRRAFANFAALASCEPVWRWAEKFIDAGLADADPETRLHAAIGTARAQASKRLNYVLQLAATGADDFRSALAPELKRHALTLCRVEIPTLMRKLTSEHLRNLLEIIASWECHLPLLDVEDLALHGDATIRCKAMELIPKLPLTPENRNAISRGLKDPNPEVNAAAAEAATQMRLGPGLSQAAAG